MGRSSGSTLLAGLLALGLLAGCAVEDKQTERLGLGAAYESGVKVLPDGNAFVEVEAAPLAGRQTGADEVATQQATAYCAQRRQKVVVVKKETDSHLLVNGVVRLTFRCE